MIQCKQKGQTMTKTETQSTAISFEDTNEFVKALWDKIVNERLFSYQKNDICDYLLYLFNAHDKGHFLDMNSNEQNERLLKMNATKIKASKKNIAVKFMNEDEYKGVFDKFLLALSQEKIALKSGSKKGYFKITLENPVFQSILEAKLKEVVKESFDLPQFNTEKVEISCVDFISVLETEAQKRGKSAVLENALNKTMQAHKIKKKDDIKSIAGKTAVQVVAGVISLGVGKFF